MHNADFLLRKVRLVNHQQLNADAWCDLAMWGEEEKRQSSLSGYDLLLVVSHLIVYAVSSLFWNLRLFRWQWKASKFVIHRVGTIEMTKKKGIKLFVDLRTNYFRPVMSNVPFFKNAPCIVKSSLVDRTWVCMLIRSRSRVLQIY